MEAQKLHAVVLKANPHYENYRIHYAVCLGALTSTHARLQDLEAALHTAETIRDLGWDPPYNAYEAATALGACIPIVQDHDKLDAMQRKVATQFYGDAAMNMLHLAFEKGFQDASKVENSPYLIPLHARQDFLALLAEMRMKPQDLAPSGK
jgi:hypothetical protein